MAKFKSTGSVYRFFGVIFVGLLGAFTLLFFGDFSLPENEILLDQPNQFETDLWRVVEIKDGDTLVAENGFNKETIRLVGIDTPESGECFSSESTARLRQLILGKTVELHTDDSQGERDHYGRLLRFVFLENGTNINKKMISEGFAREYTYQSHYKYQEDFQSAEEEARHEKRGLWADDTCAGLVDGLGSGIVDPSCRIKGNISSSGAKNYHLVECRDWKKTKINLEHGERWFCSEAEAVAAGWRRARSCSP